MLSWSVLYGSTGFLIGPKRQVTMMLDPVRIYATAIYLASIIIALFCALYVSCLIYISFIVIFHIPIQTYLLVSHIAQFFTDWIEQVRNKLLTLFAIILEFGSLIWYVTMFILLIINLFYSSYSYFMTCSIRMELKFIIVWFYCIWEWKWPMLIYESNFLKFTLQTVQEEP